MIQAVTTRQRAGSIPSVNLAQILHRKLYRVKEEQTRPKNNITNGVEWIGIKERGGLNVVVNGSRQGCGVSLELTLPQAR